MPTQTEVQELVDNCTFTASTYNGVKGNYVTGPDGNSIFLPFAGYCYAGKFHEKEGEYGCTHDERQVTVYCLRCHEDSGQRYSSAREIGISIRPVKEK